MLLVVHLCGKKKEEENTECTSIDVTFVTRRCLTCDLGHLFHRKKNECREKKMSQHENRPREYNTCRMTPPKFVCHGLGGDMRLFMFSEKSMLYPII